MELGGVGLLKCQQGGPRHKFHDEVTLALCFLLAEPGLRRLVHETQGEAIVAQLEPAPDDPCPSIPVLNRLRIELLGDRLDGSFLRPRLVQRRIDTSDRMPGIGRVTVDGDPGAVDVAFERVWAGALAAEIMALTDKLAGLIECHAGREAEDIGLFHVGEGRRLQEARLDRDDGCDSDNDQTCDDDSDLHEHPAETFQAL